MLRASLWFSGFVVWMFDDYRPWYIYFFKFLFFQYKLEIIFGGLISDKVY